MVFSYIYPHLAKRTHFSGYQGYNGYTNEMLLTGNVFILFADQATFIMDVVSHSGSMWVHENKNQKGSTHRYSEFHIWVEEK